MSTGNLINDDYFLKMSEGSNYLLYLQLFRNNSARLFRLHGNRKTVPIGLTCLKCEKYGHNSKKETFKFSVVYDYIRNDNSET